MDQLIFIGKSAGGRDVVSAKELYDKLNLVKSQWSRWAKKNIETNPYAEENVDWVGFDIMSNGNVTKDFYVTTTFAKKLAMQVRTEEGEMVRDYFIECERIAHSKSPTIGGHGSIPQTFSQALQLAADQARKLEEQQLLIEEAKPKVEFYEAVTGSSDTVDIGTVAKTLNFPKIGRTNLFEILRNEKVLMRDNKPFQVYVDRGWFRVVESSYSKPDGSSHVNFKTVVFQKGVEGIRKLLTEKYS